MGAAMVPLQDLRTKSMSQAETFALVQISISKPLNFVQIQRLF